MPTPTIDFSVFDHQEVVTYTPLTEPAVENVAALRRPLTQSRQRNVERYVDLLATDVIFHLDGAPLATTTLTIGDSITDAESRIYQAVFVERQTLNGVVVLIGRIM